MRNVPQIPIGKPVLRGGLAVEQQLPLSHPLSPVSAPLLLQYLMMLQ